MGDVFGFPHQQQGRITNGRGASVSRNFWLACSSLGGKLFIDTDSNNLTPERQHNSLTSVAPTPLTPGSASFFIDEYRQVRPECGRVDEVVTCPAYYPVGENYVFQPTPFWTGCSVALASRRRRPAARTRFLVLIVTTATRELRQLLKRRHLITSVQRSHWP